MSCRCLDGSRGLYMYRALGMSCKVAVEVSRRAAEGSRGAVESSRALGEL